MPVLFWLNYLWECGIMLVRMIWNFKGGTFMDSKAFVKYISALLLFGLNGIVASHISLNSYEIVFYER